MKKFMIGATSSLALLLSLAFAQQASAGFSFLCSGCTVSGNSRIVRGPFSNVTRVYFATNNGDGVSHCASGKGQSNGLGPDTSGLFSVCGTAQIQQTQCSSPRFTYPTGINQSSSPHVFTLGAYVNNCSI